MSYLLHARFSAVLRITLLILPLSFAACDELPGPGPTESGSIVGTVTANGAGIAGVTVSLSNGSTATTGATGTYSFSNVLLGAYTVTISGYPSDVTFPATVQAAVVATSGQTVVVNFSGTRLATGPSTPTDVQVTGTLTCVGGDSSHDPHVFNAGGGKAATVRVSVVNGTTVTIVGVAGFSPSSLPPLTGTVNAATATGSATGAGTIAGRGNVSVGASGTFTADRVEVNLLVGGQAELPGGQPIQYRFVATQ